VLCVFGNGKNFRHFWSKTEVDRNVLFDFFCVTAAELFNRCAEILLLSTACVYILRTKIDMRKRIKKGGERRGR
jgi:hypothetical protein